MPADDAPLPPPTPREIVGVPRPVSPLAYGCWRFAGNDPGHARALIEAALEAGMDLVDTADIYGLDGPGWGSAEELLGRVLADAPGLRERIVLATKGGIRPGVPYDWSGPYLAGACEASLRRLGVDHVELYQLHRPDVLTPPDDTAAALTSLHERGLIGAVGLSNVTPVQVDLLRSRLDLPIATTQPELSAWHPAPAVDGTLDHALTRGIAVLAWSPLGGGRVGDPEHPATAALARVAAEHGVGVEAAALAWVLAHPSRPIAIVGTQRPERVAAAADALGVRLTRRQWYDVLQASTGEPLP